MSGIRVSRAGAMTTDFWGIGGLVWYSKGWRFEADNVPEAENIRLADAEGLAGAAIPTAFRAYRQTAGEMLRADMNNPSVS